jgi:hypothetical protein
MIENNNTHSSNPYSFSTSKFYNNQKQNLDKELVTFDNKHINELYSNFKSKYEFYNKPKKNNYISIFQTGRNNNPSKPNEKYIKTHNTNINTNNYLYNNIAPKYTINNQLKNNKKQNYMINKDQINNIKIIMNDDKNNSMKDLKNKDNNKINFNHINIGINNNNFIIDNKKSLYNKSKEVDLTSKKNSKNKVMINNMVKTETDTKKNNLYDKNINSIFFSNKNNNLKTMAKSQTTSKNNKTKKNINSHYFYNSSDKNYYLNKNNNTTKKSGNNYNGLDNKKTSNNNNISKEKGYSYKKKNTNQGNKFNKTKKNGLNYEYKLENIRERMKNLLEIYSKLLDSKIKISLIKN